jgi:hypothetical protein
MGCWSRILDGFRNAQRRQADLLHATARRLMFYAEPTRGDSGQAGRLRGHPTLLGAEGYTQNQRAIEEPWSVFQTSNIETMGRPSFFLPTTTAIRIASASLHRDRHPQATESFPNEYWLSDK